MTWYPKIIQPHYLDDPGLVPLTVPGPNRAATLQHRFAARLQLPQASASGLS